MSITRKKILYLLCSMMFYSVNLYAAEKSRTVQWLDSKFTFSIEKILANTSPYDGRPGSVLAATSRYSPDYYYHWVRDAGLAMIALADAYQGTQNLKTKRQIYQQFFDYLNFSTLIQKETFNLGEPKFYVSGDVYNKPWGRPQNDGPALRAISLIRFSNILIKEGKESVVRQRLYASQFPAISPIKLDLEYISHHWKDASFDIWEEVKGRHFYTLMVIRRALLEGSTLANHLGDLGAAKWYRLQAREIEKELLNFWDNDRGYIKATINHAGGLVDKESNLDVAVLLGLLHGNMNDHFLSWDHPYVTATIEKIIKAFALLYPINQRQNIPGTAIGRYPEDRYGGDNFNGGNPWPLCTLAVAEALYQQANIFRNHGEYSRGLQVSKIADQFVERVKYHAYPDGSLDEQIQRRTGYMTSAHDLTWNYASLLTTRRAALK